MKKITLLLLLLLFAAGSYAQSVGINSDGSTPDGSAMLDVKSTSKGFLAPRMTRDQRNSILTPATGLMVYQTDNDPGYYLYDGSNWVKSSSFWTSDLEGGIYYNSGNVGIGTTTPGYKLTVQGGEIVSASDTDAGLVFTGTDGTANDMTVRYNRTNARLEFRDNLNSETRMVIKQDGNVGIGTTTPGAKLHIAGSGNNWPAMSGTTQSDGLIARLQSASNAILDIGGNTNYGFWLQSTDQTTLSASYPLILNPNGGNVGIGTTTPSYALYVNGTSGGTNAWNSSSDARLKKDVVAYENGIDKVMQLRPVTFNWKQDAYPDINFDDRNHVGFIAQEVEEVVPQVVSTANDEMQTKSIAYSDLVPVLTKAIQEQQAEIDALKKELEEIKKVLQYKK